MFIIRQGIEKISFLSCSVSRVCLKNHSWKIWTKFIVNKSGHKKYFPKIMKKR